MRGGHFRERHTVLHYCAAAVATLQIHRPKLCMPTSSLTTYITLQWDSGVVWATIQPTARGQFNWSVMDRDAGQARKRGQKVLFTLGQSPSW
jgi:hypothetical protein